MYPQLNRVRLTISALANLGMGNNILKVPRCPRLGFCINCHQRALMYIFHISPLNTLHIDITAQSL